MKFRPLGKTDLVIGPLVFGGNVFGWTIDEKTSFAVLDAFVAHGFNAIDTADVYSTWAPGNKGGESETIIGNWLKARPGMREKVVLFSKVGSDMGSPDCRGQTERWILRAVDDSLKRLKVETIDLYFSHWPDTETPYDETQGAYDKLLRVGKIRAVGASNFDVLQLGQALEVARLKGLPPYQVLQPQYNLYDRGFEGPLREFCLREGLGVVTYSSLASGFLSGKYRTRTDLDQSRRSEEVTKYFTPYGMTILSALDKVAARNGAKLAEIALAWLMACDGVTAPIASATNVGQVESFARAAELRLSSEDIVLLDEPEVTR